MRRVWWFAGLFAVASCASPPSTDLPAGSAEHPDIVLISLDTLRADHLGAYGYDRETSPFLDERARTGTVFEQAWAPAPWTLPTHASLLSGRLPFSHGAIDEEHAIGSDVAMLPESLGVLGYRRAGFVTAPFVSARYGFDRGFDHFDDLSLRIEGATPDAEQVTAAAMAWARELEEGRPAFLFLHFYDVHYPYAPPAPFDTRFDPAASPQELKYEHYFHYFDHPLSPQRLQIQIDQYDEEIAYVDAMLERFCTAWQRARPNTIFVVVSDHGEEFGERGSWGHAHTLTPEQLHVPWIVWGRGIAKQRVAVRVGLEDVPATLAELAGTGFGPFDGHSRARILREGAGPGDPEGGLFASTSRRNTLRVRRHQHPLDMIVDLRSKAVAVYDLDADPRAMHDLSREPSTPLAELWAATIESMGLPWEAERRIVAESDGVFVTASGGILAGRATFDAGDRFGLFPLDASLTVIDDGKRRSPLQQLGGALPSADDPVILHVARSATEPLSLSDQEKEKLESLGYAH